MSRTFHAALLALGSLACTSAERGSAAGASRERLVSEESCGSRTGASQSSGIVRAEPPPAARRQDPELEALLGLLDQARKAKEEEDHALARARIALAIERALVEIGKREDETALGLLEGMGRFAHDCGELRSAEKAWRSVLDVRTRTLPDDHPDMQRARGSLANTIRARGDLQGARALEEKVLEVSSRTLPDDHPDLQVARGNLANTLRALGDLEGARALHEEVLEVRSRTLPENHPDLQEARGNLANTLHSLGDLPGARELQVKVLEVFTQTLPDDHRGLQAARGNLANTLRALGDLEGARALQEQVFEVFSRTLPEDHPELQKARQNLANTLLGLGDLQGARDLQEIVLEVRSRTLPDDHPDLQAARLNLAGTILALGDLQGARALQEKVLEVRSRTLPDDHPNLQRARENLASTLHSLGDLPGARALDEKVLEVRSRTLPEGHPDLQRARGNLAATLGSLGDDRGALTLNEAVLEVFSRTLPEDHPNLQVARANLASVLSKLGDFEGARALLENVLDVSRTLPDEHRGVSCSRHNLAGTLASIPDWAALESVAAEFGQGLRSLLEDAVLTSSSREAEERVANESKHVSLSLSHAELLASRGLGGDSARDALTLVETARGAGVAAAVLRNRMRGDPRARACFERATRASAELARLGKAGTGSDAFAAAARERDEAQRAIAAMAASRSDIGSLLTEPRPEILAQGLAPGKALVGYWRYTRTTWKREHEKGPVRVTSEERLLAHVVRHDGSFTRVELGPIAPIEQAVRAWRADLGAATEARGVAGGESRGAASRVEEQGRELRRLVFDPLGEALRGVDHASFVLDDVLHLVPLDALPAEDPGAGEDLALLGDKLHVETRVTVVELLAPAEEGAGGGGLVVLGGVTYGAAQAGTSPSAAVDAPMAAPVARADQLPGRADDRAGILRGGAWSSGFGDLPATRAEARAIAREFEGCHGTGERVTVLEGGEATRERLLELAPRARWLHVATHGWFASESIRSWKDPEPLDRLSGLGLRLSGEEQVKGMSPLLLCGLALAGANLPEDELGRVPGLITAEEIAALDLSGCELAVLSACDTSVGVRRAGQGVASLQRALHMAGARSVITSLWKVPDEATRELMTDFYRRIWVEQEPKAEALWAAKRGLREAKDESGDPRYTTRDWAAWVLTGDPR